MDQEESHCCCESAVPTSSFLSQLLSELYLLFVSERPSLGVLGSLVYSQLEGGPTITPFISGLSLPHSSYHRSPLRLYSELARSMALASGHPQPARVSPLFPLLLKSPVSSSPLTRKRSSLVTASRATTSAFGPTPRYSRSGRSTHMTAGCWDQP